MALYSLARYVTMLVAEEFTDSASQSMAVPFVAGLVAYLIGMNGDLAPNDTSNWIIDWTTKDALSNIRELCAHLKECLDVDLFYSTIHAQPSDLQRRRMAVGYQGETLAVMVMRLVSYDRRVQFVSGSVNGWPPWLAFDMISLTRVSVSARTNEKVK